MKLLSMLALSSQVTGVLEMVQTSVVDVWLIGFQYILLLTK